MRQAVILILSCLALNGCVPVPHPRELVSPISGVLEKDGKPVAGAEVRAISGRRSSSKVITDAEGRFLTGSVWDLELAVYLVAGCDFTEDSLEVHFAGDRYVTSGERYLYREAAETGGGVVCEIPDTAEKVTIEDVVNVTTEDVDNAGYHKVEVRRMLCRKR